MQFGFRNYIPQKIFNMQLYDRVKSRVIQELCGLEEDAGTNPVRRTEWSFVTDLNQRIV